MKNVRATNNTPPISSNAYPVSYLNPNTDQSAATVLKEISNFRPNRNLQKRSYNKAISMKNSDFVVAKKPRESSLKQICTSILNKFIHDESKEIKLNDFAVELNLERRRVYDIINVLEAFDMVKKHGKNRYIWQGIADLNRALTELNLLEPPKIYHVKVFSHEKLQLKKKSLTYLSIKLLKLFTIHKDNINFKELIKLFGEKYLNLKLNNEDKELKQNENKNKIRRLYDIINVFKSLGLIEKVLNSSGKSVLTFKGLQGLHQNLNQLKSNYHKSFNIEEIKSVKSDKVQTENSFLISPQIRKTNSMGNSIFFKNDLFDLEIIRNNKKIKVMEITSQNLQPKSKLYSKKFFTNHMTDLNFPYKSNLNKNNLNNCLVSVQKSDQVDSLSLVDDIKKDFINKRSERLKNSLNQIKKQYFEKKHEQFFNILNCFLDNSLKFL